MRQIKADNRLIDAQTNSMVGPENNKNKLYNKLAKNR